MSAVAKQNQVRETYVSTVEQHRPYQQQVKKSSSLLNKLSACLCLVISVGAVWMVASRGAQMDRLNYSIDHMQAQIQTAQAQNATLTSQVDRLMSPDRILSIASHLGMVHANPVQIPGTSH